MGNFRSVPVTTKDTVVGEGNGLVFGVTGMEGYRKGMEVRSKRLCIACGGDSCAGTPREGRGSRVPAS